MMLHTIIGLSLLSIFVVISDAITYHSDHLNFWRRYKGHPSFDANPIPNCVRAVNEQERFNTAKYLSENEEKCLDFGLCYFRDPKFFGGNLCYFPEDPCSTTTEIPLRTPCIEGATCVKGDGPGANGEGVHDCVCPENSTRTDCRNYDLTCADVPQDQKIECWNLDPILTLTIHKSKRTQLKEECEARGCCFAADDINDLHFAKTPFCFFRRTISGSRVGGDSKIPRPSAIPTAS